MEEIDEALERLEVEEPIRVEMRRSAVRRFGLVSVSTEKSVGFSGLPCFL